MDLYRANFINLICINMNPHIILFKIFLMLSLANSPSEPKQPGLSDFVIKKKTSIYAKPGIISQQPVLRAPNSGSIMQKVSHNQELAIFCKMEHELMKASGFAIKFRLGDQSFVDQIEGK